jgi:cation transport ATPase
MSKNNLDEMLEDKLLKIEQKGMWFCFWGLLIAVLVQELLGMPFVQFAGELIIFIILAIYILICCLKEGIWDRYLRATIKTNLIISIICAIVFSSIVTTTNYFRYEVCREDMLQTMGMFIITAISLFSLCFIALWLTSAIYKKRRAFLDNSFEDESKDT